MKSLSKLIVLNITFFVSVSFGFAQTSNVYNYRVINQSVNDLVYSSYRHLIYASVPSTGGNFGNNIIAIDPYSKQITSSVFVGSEPNRLAISDDQQFLYVGLDGSASVRKIVLSSFTADINILLGSGSNGFNFAEDIAVLSGQPNSIAVSRRNSCCSPRHEGIAIYDSGVMRPVVTPSHTGSNVIESGDNESNVYGYNNETSDFGFRRMSLNPQGINVISNLQNAIQGYGVDIKYSNGLIYSSTGIILNPISNSLSGTFALGGYANGLAPDQKTRRVFFITGNSINGFNSLNYQPTGSISLADSAATSARLTRWGRRGLAFRNENKKLVILETSLVPAQPNTSDFNGDEMADYAVFRPQGAIWYSTGGNYATSFGVESDVPVAGDYDGDNKTDIAIFRNGSWWILSSSNQTVSVTQFGISTDKPVPADYDGDQKTDLAVFRDGIWWIMRSSDAQINTVQFGVSADKPVQSDYDGDGRTDIAVYRPGIGNWYIRLSDINQYTVVHYGIPTAKPAPADYDGDGKSDVAVLQNTFGQPLYYVLQSSNGQERLLEFGQQTGSIPVPADFDGDGVMDPTVLSLESIWTTILSKNNSRFNVKFGMNGDLPIQPR